MSNAKDHVKDYQRNMSYYIGAHLFIYAGVAYLFHLPLVMPLVLQAVMTALIFTGMAFYQKNRALALDLSAVSIALTPAVLVYMLSGHAWQLDAHMYFFAALAMTIAFKSMRAAFMATVAIALHHLVLNFIMPYAVFPEGANFARVVFHAVIVLVETAVILITIRGLLDNDAKIMAESTTAQEALAAANKAKQLQEETEKKARSERARVMQDLSQDFDTHIGGLIGSLAKASGELQSTAEQMRNIAEKTALDSDQVAQASADTSQNVNTVASAMEEMSATTSEIASQITSVKNKSNDAAQNAQNANQTVNNLDGLAKNIGGVVVAIRDIAEQTNLLALNATIEAARAGEAGKGFSVVADEVKKLANETAKKTNEIEEKISDIQNATHESVAAMARIIDNIGNIDTSMTEVSAAIEEQNSTAKEIVRSVSHASDAVEGVSGTIQSVQRGSEETGQSADIVFNSSNKVAQLSDQLKSAVTQFLMGLQSQSEDDKK